MLRCACRRRCSIVTDRLVRWALDFIELGGPFRNWIRVVSGRERRRQKQKLAGRGWRGIAQC
jgi:hypothetical protein